MQLIAKANLSRIKAAFGGALVRGISAFGAAELSNRVVRILTTVVIARQLSPNVVGKAALALTLFELVRVLANIGIGQQIIAASGTALSAVCNTAHRLFWLWSLMLIFIQLGLALMLASLFDQTQAAGMLVLLALVYPLMPGGLVQCYLAMREGMNGALARTSATQAISDHILTAMLLLIWPSPWSIILPKLLTAPIWLFMTRRNRPWSPDKAAGYAHWRPMLRFGGGVLAADGLTALRQQGDNLLIAALMGSTALGTYYFAYNAGLGMITALVTAFGTVSYPMLCQAPAGEARRNVLLKLVLGAIILFVPLVAAQAIFAPFYVPILFGDHWSFAAPLISILCLAGLAQLASVIVANWLRAEGRIGADVRRSLIGCLCALSGLYLGAMMDRLEWAVAGLVIGTCSAAFSTAFLTLGPALRSPSTPCPAKELHA